MERILDPHTASFAKRARVSAASGPYLLLAGLVLGGIGWSFAKPDVLTIALMALLAVAMQMPRQIGWRRKSDLIESLCLLSMPITLAIIGYAWLHPNGDLTFANLSQGLGGFFVALGLFHIFTKTHTLRLADQIERSG